MRDWDNYRERRSETMSQQLFFCRDDENCGKHSIGNSFIFQHYNNLKPTVNSVKVYLDLKKKKKHTMEHDQSWIGLPRVWTSTLLKQCRIPLTGINLPTSKCVLRSLENYSWRPPIEITSKLDWESADCAEEYRWSHQILTLYRLCFCLICCISMYVCMS